MTTVRKETGVLTADLMDVKSVIMEYFKQLNVHMLGNLAKRD